MTNFKSEENHAYLALKSWMDERRNPSQHGPGVTLRSRPPFTQTSKHDARGDAINIIYENLTTR